jgi:O-antigen/teichoic acid export membrane protein
VEDNSRWSRKSLRPRGQFSVANRLLYIVGPAPGSERLRISGYDHSFHWVLGLFRDFGLSAAAVQRRVITEEQISALFWINILVGVLLGLLALAMAPAVAGSYHDPQLFWVTAILATGFLFNAAGVRHSALLERQMRFTVLAVISVVSLIAATTIAIISANAGYGYWALVAMSVTQPLMRLSVYG